MAGGLTVLFIRHRKSLDPFYDEYAEVYYVDGTYVTSVGRL